MAIIDFKLPLSLSRALNIPESSPKRQQLKVLQKLLKTARFTEFGQKYLFDQILLTGIPVKISNWSCRPLPMKRFLKSGGLGRLMANGIFAGQVRSNFLRLAVAQVNLPVNTSPLPKN